MLDPPIVRTLLIAMTPVGELRVALPLALTHYDLPLAVAFPVAVVGNMIPAAAITYLLEPVSGFLSHHSRTAARFFEWLFAHTRRRHSRRFEALGAMALVTFVAIPLPMTGAWTGALAAFVFGITPRVALPLIGLGVVIAGVIVTAITTGVTLL